MSGLDAAQAASHRHLPVAEYGDGYQTAITNWHCAICNQRIPVDGLRVALAEELKWSPVPLAKWLPSGKAVDLTDDDRDWIAGKIVDGLFTWGVK